MPYSLLLIKYRRKWKYKLNNKFIDNYFMKKLLKIY